MPHAAVPFLFRQQRIALFRSRGVSHNSAFWLLGREFPTLAAFAKHEHVSADLNAVPVSFAISTKYKVGHFADGKT